jgi:predicted Na+-dependent transporter
LLVWALTHLFNVPRDAAIGLLLVGVASAGPLGITASRIAGGDARAALSFVVVLEAANAAAIPYGWPCCCRLVSSFRSVN